MELFPKAWCSGDTGFWCLTSTDVHEMLRKPLIQKFESPSKFATDWAVSSVDPGAANEKYVMENISVQSAHCCVRQNIDCTLLEVGS